MLTTALLTACPLLLSTVTVKVPVADEAIGLGSTSNCVSCKSAAEAALIPNSDINPIRTNRTLKFLKPPIARHHSF